ncbi:hypothetical protein B0H19DRAFT_484905 [Mycena capillaripes]|nr:hypothetical protein B0H19DRAFT_484905 [Mycena capillaripes]
MVEAHIQRSRTLKIHFHGCPNTDARPQIQLFELLSQCSSRWEELSIGLTSATVPLLAALRDRVSSLKRVWVQWNGLEHPPVEFIDCFQTASSLVDVGAFYMHRFVPMALPMPQLTRYQLCCPWEVHKSILTLAPNLVEARIDIEYDDAPWPESVETINLLHLRRLFISDLGVFDYLKAPILEELALLVRQTDNPHVLHLFDPFLERSTCHLRRLYLQMWPYTETAIKMVQRSYVTEIVISIHDPDASDDIDALISALTVSEVDGSTTAAPHLRCLFFGCENKSYIDYTVYLKMLESRWKADNCALTTAALLINSGPGPDYATLRGLDELRLEGLDLLLMEGKEATQEMRRWSYKTLWN